MKKIFCALLIFFIVLVALFPMLLSLPLVQRWILPETISVSAIQASWFEGIQIDGLVIKDSNDACFITAESIKSKKSLISWLYNPADFGCIVVQKPTFKLDPLGPLLFEGEEDSALYIPDFFTLDIRDATIHINKTEISLSDLSALLDIKQKTALQCTLSSKIENKIKNGTVLGSLSLDLAIGDVDKLKDTYQRVLIAPKTTVSLHAKLNSFPTGIIDPALLLSVGETVDCKLEHTVGRDASSFTFDITSAFLNGRIGGKKKGHLIWERPSCFLKMSVDPSKPLGFDAAVDLTLQKEDKEAHCHVGASFDALPAVALRFHAAGNWPELVAPQYCDILGNNAVISADVQMTTVLDPGKEDSATVSFQSETGAFTSTISCSNNLVLIKSKSETVTCELHAPFEIDEAKARCDANFTLQGFHDKLELSGGLLYDRINHLFSSSGSFHGGCSFLKEPFRALLGPSLSGSWNVSSDHITAHLEGENLLADLNLAIGKKIGALGWKKPLTIQGALTPERFQALFSLLNGKAPKLVLLQSAPFSLSCNEFSSQGLDLNTLDSKLDLQLGALVCENQKTNKVNKLPELYGRATLESEKVSLFFDIESQKTDDAPYLFMKGHASKLWNEKGVNLTEADVNVDLTLKQFPIDHLPVGRLVKITGPNVEALLHIEIEKLSSGKANGTIHSDRLEMALDLLIQEGKLLLAKPLTATFSLPHKTEGRVKLLVDSKDFCVPLAPFSLKTMIMPSITLDPGVVTVENGGLLGTILSLLRLDTNSHGKVPMWFTPIYLDVKKGIVTCKRTDILVSNAFPMALWGKVDLEKDSVDFKLGLTGQALRRAFGIIIFSSDYLLQIPIQGTIESPKLDTPVATAKIAALRLQQTPMPTTMIFGGILGMATYVVDKNEKPPKPTTSPLPWELKPKRPPSLD